ncbi:MAG: 30S ribosomal protein S12 methylthiotransferase RimO [Deltaproteobacteria bacterium]|nr:30S ribosomal protein S12 methylthiotransferase RimO [Deltaproteobacteria bacterium]
MDLRDPQAGPLAVHFLSLGCPKNRLDTEVMIGSLALGGYAVAERVEDADVAVVNTCSFIESAREESIQAILDVCDRKEEGQLRAVVVAGCLPQRYANEIAKELPEVDAFVGTGEFPRLPAILGEALEGRGGVYVEAGRTHLYDEHDPRVLIGQTHTAYMKLSEGCDRVCAFCAIPGIRGKFQSRTGESLVAEARQLAAAGVREINLVAQDSTSWGKDLPGRPGLDTVLRDLDGVDGLDWIRCLYLYPTAITDELLDVLASGKRVLPYVDVPLQHASDRLLKAMKRGTTAARQADLVERLRSRVPGLTLRTTFIVGFPGETDADFEELCDFVRKVRFDRLGAFRYSDEEDTAAFDYEGKVPRELARERHRELLRISREILTEKLESMIGSEATVLVDSADPGSANGRLATQAPEIDGVVFLTGGEAQPGETHLAAGEMRQVRITGTRGADLDAELLG